MRFITREEIKQAVEAVDGGWKYKADRPISNHDGDWYLRIVLAERDYNLAGITKEYVTWHYNASIGGLHEGRYTFNEEIAENDYKTRS